MNYSAQYQVLPATYHVISRKADQLWDSVNWKAKTIEQMTNQKIGFEYSSEI